MAKVLVLDDDLQIAQAVAKIVSFCQHEPIIETDSIHAVMRWGRADIGAVIVDLLMPRLDGVDVLAVFQESNPRVRRIMLTAAPEEKIARDAVTEGIVQKLIAKPCRIEEIEFALAWL